jgi:hypothetical protein
MHICHCLVLLKLFKMPNVVECLYSNLAFRWQRIVHCNLKYRFLHIGTLEILNHWYNFIFCLINRFENLRKNTLSRNLVQLSLWQKAEKGRQLQIVSHIECLQNPSRHLLMCSNYFYTQSMIFMYVERTQLGIKLVYLI